ncbi:hypothetical protein HU200_032077 [Digitaria exilis]|uniref:Serine hydrolase domain-containing protein n=1 Tax=Digitaria exilis TaxID=1010633 RepID=A0A835BK89_9POAL|nr:hypothetical protein HU200_032077 [Digitaria exilis]
MPAAATASFLDRRGAVSFPSRAALPIRLPAYAPGAPSSQTQGARHGLRLRNAGAAPRQLNDASLGGEGDAARRRPRLLCLHGFRTSAEIMRRQVVGRWPAEVTSRLDLVFADAPLPAGGASPVAGVFDPPYYERFQFVGEVRSRNPVAPHWLALDIASTCNSK